MLGDVVNKAKDGGTPGAWRYDAVIENLITIFNSRLAQEMQLNTRDLVEKVSLRLEAILKSIYEMSAGHSNKATEEEYDDDVQIED